MNAAHDAFERRLLTLCGDEARGHLAHSDDAVAELAEHGAAAHGAPLRAVPDSLHTLKGAPVRSRWATSNTCATHSTAWWPPAAATLQPGQLAIIRAALELAGQLLEPPAGRVRNQTLAVAGQLDQLARALGASQLPGTGA